MADWTPPDRSRSRAVLVGTSRYAQLTQVPAAANSLESMRRLLTGPLCAWPEDRVTVIAERESPGNLPDLLVELFAQAQDVALFYYVGHGQVDFEDQLCLGLTGSLVTSERRATTSLTFEAVRRALRASPAATKVVILDCCFAGHAVDGRHTLSGADEVDVTSLVGASGAYTLAATGPASTAWFEADTDSPLPHTHFTRALLDTVTRGIPGEAAVLTLEPVYRRLREVLHASGRPTPTRNSRDLAGDFVFARNVTPRPAPQLPAATGPGDDPVRMSGLLDDAEDAARAIADPAGQCDALIDIAQAGAALGNQDRARGLLDEAERLIGTLSDRRAQAVFLHALAGAVVVEDPARARRLLDAFETAITSKDVPSDERDWSLASGLTEQPALFRLDPDRAERLARAINMDTYRAHFVAQAAGAVATRDPGRAERLANAAPDLNARGNALEQVVSAIVDDAPDHAERIARGITDTGYKAQALAGVAAAVGPRDPQRGLELLGEAEAAARKAGDPDSIAENLMHVVYALRFEHRLKHASQNPLGIDWLREQASRITDEIVLPHHSAQAAIATAKAMLPDNLDEAGRLLNFAVSQYEEIAADADQATRWWEKHKRGYILRDAAIAMLKVDKKRALSIASHTPLEPFYMRDQVYVVFVPALAPDDPALAEALAHGIIQLDRRAPALATVAKALAGYDPAGAAALVEHARRLAHTDKVVSDIAAVVAAYNPDLAITILKEDSRADDRSEGLARITEVVAKADLDGAEAIARTIADPAYRLRALTHIANLYATSAESASSR